MDLPDFNFEEKLWQRGFRFVAGADEVGRGSFAGPVVAAAVVFEPTALALSSRAFGSQKGANRSLVQINDSKKLRPRQREKAAIWIKEISTTKIHMLKHCPVCLNAVTGFAHKKKEE